MLTMRLRSPWVPALLSVAAALSLLGPWARSGSVDRSSVELLASAGVLDVVTPAARVAALAGWYLVVLASAAALVAASWGRVRTTAALAIPVGPAMVGACVIVARSPLDLRWAAPLGAVLGLTATVAGALVLMGRPAAAEGER